MRLKPIVILKQALARKITALLLGIFFMLFGPAACAAGRAEESLPLPRPLGSDLPTFRAPAPSQDVPDSLGDGAATREPTGTVALRQALALALMRNPELRAFSWEVRAQEATTLQAGLFHNPTIGANCRTLWFRPLRRVFPSRRRP